jgi:hypothetical protein
VIAPTALGPSLAERLILSLVEPVYDLWHLAFANLVEQRAPPDVSVLSEVRLTIEPLRADLLLLRRTGAPRRDGEARVLHAIWPRLAKVTVVELKSPTRSSFRSGDLIRLWTYGSLYHATHLDEISALADLTLLLVVPSVTPTLRDEIAMMGWQIADLGGGYRRLDGAVYALYVAVTDEVAEAEHDGFLRLFSRLPGADPEAARWVRHWMKEATMTQKMEDIPGYDDIFEKILEELPPRTRMVGLTPEQRLEGLSEEQRILALSDETLRQFPDSYLRTFSPEAQETLRRRIGRPAGS